MLTTQPNIYPILLHAFPPKNFRYWVQSRGLTYFSDVCFRYLPLLCKIRHPVYCNTVYPACVWSGSSVRVTMLTVVTTARPALCRAPQPRPSPAPAHNAASQHQCTRSGVPPLLACRCWFLFLPISPVLLGSGSSCSFSTLSRAGPPLAPLTPWPGTTPHHKGWEGWETWTRPQSNMQSIKCPILHFIFIAPRIKFQETYYGWFNSNIIYTKGWINIFLRNKAKITGSLSSSHLGYASLQPVPHYSRVVKCSFEIQSFN